MSFVSALEGIFLAPGYRVGVEIFTELSAAREVPSVRSEGHLVARSLSALRRPPVTTRPGQSTLGHFSNVGKIGEGGTGEVYGARDERLDHGIGRG